MRRLWIACLPWLAACGFRSPAGEPADASLCFDGFTRVCLQALPATQLVIASNMELDTAAGCETTTMGTAAGVCVIAATAIEVRSDATLRAIVFDAPMLQVTGTAMAQGGGGGGGSGGVGAGTPGADPTEAGVGAIPGDGYHAGGGTGGAGGTGAIAADAGDGQAGNLIGGGGGGGGAGIVRSSARG